jgi:hypothetical protein
VLGAVGPEPRSGDYPILNKLFATAQAEISRASGNPADAVKLLTPFLDGNELYLMHIALLDAYSASGSGSKDLALEQAQWLATHRGRAYIEYGTKAAIPFNVAQSNIALLSLAELLKGLNREEEARHALQDLRKAWPNAEQEPAFATRLKALGISYQN